MLNAQKPTNCLWWFMLLRKIGTKKEYFIFSIFELAKKKGLREHPLID
jgi:hypothetical protein